MKVSRDDSSKPRGKYSKLGSEIIALAGLTTLVITPSLTIDAFNPPKFALLVSGVTYLGLRYWKIIHQGLARRHILLTLAFLLTTYLLVLVANTYSISERLFGIQGRNLGLITLVAFTLFGFYSFQATRSNLLSTISVLNGLALTNVAVCFVLFLQETGIIFADYSVAYPSTLGNPNFTSAFIAISFLGTLNWMFHNKHRPFLVLIGIVVSTCSLYIVVISQSIQGLVVLVISLTVIALIISFRYLSKLLVLIFCFFLGVITLIFSFGFLNYGPLGDLLYQQTLRNRLIYWEIATRIGLDSPLFGKGYDAYLDHYRVFVRESDFEKLAGPVISDSPHNIFLDLFVSGGLLLGLPISSLIAFALIRGLYFIKRDLKLKRIEVSSVLLYAVFLSVIAICMVSPFQIGLFVWLPMIIGVLLGLNMKGSIKEEKNLVISQRTLNYGSSAVLGVSIFICNFIFAALPVVKEVRLKIAAQEGSFVKLEKVALAWPFSGPRAIAISQGFLDTSKKLDAESLDQDVGAQSKLLLQTALKIAASAVEANEKEITGWTFLLQNSPNLTTKEKARKRLQELYPINPEGNLFP